jgi:hypothetical protein
MTPAEKRYFKLYASRHVKWGKGNQQLLFDAIGAMEVYDEAGAARAPQGCGVHAQFLDRQAQVV